MTVDSEECQVWRQTERDKSAVEVAHHINAIKTYEFFERDSWVFSVLYDRY